MKDATDGKEEIVAEDVFDAIYDSHTNGVHHIKVAVTRNSLKEGIP